MSHNKKIYTINAEFAVVYSYSVSTEDIWKLKLFGIVRGYEKRGRRHGLQ